MRFDLKNVKPMVWIRLIAVAVVCGAIALDALTKGTPEAYSFAVGSVTTLLSAWWYNNSLTADAQLADEVLSEIKGSDESYSEE